MATVKVHCSICNEDDTYECKGCLKIFCFHHLTEHRKLIDNEFNQFEDTCNSFRQDLIDKKTDPNISLLIERINLWEKESIEKIQRTADRCRQRLMKYTNEYMSELEKKFNDLSEIAKQIRKRNTFNEIDLNELNKKLTTLKKELDTSLNVSIVEETTSFINKLSIKLPLNPVTKWKQIGLTVAGGNGQGNQLNQLCKPVSIFIDIDQTLYIADRENNCIVEWRANATNGRIVVNENLVNTPTNVIFDKENDSLIISDTRNRRVIRWSRKNTNGISIISNIDCWGLAMDKDGSLYVSDWNKQIVRRWKRGDKDGTIVAGGNGEGNQLNQLNTPSYIFVDEDYSLYISDVNNHRVMKWLKDAKEGIIVAGGNGQGNSLKQLSKPLGVIVDQFGQIFVAEWDNQRVIRWREGEKEGKIVIGGNGEGHQSNQLKYPKGLSFDHEGNLYVVDSGNYRIQKFEIDEDENN